VGYDALRNQAIYPSGQDGQQPQESLLQAARRVQQEQQLQLQLQRSGGSVAQPFELAGGSVGGASGGAGSKVKKVVKVRRHPCVAEGWLTQAEFDSALHRFNRAAAPFDGDLPAPQACELLTQLLRDLAEDAKRLPGPRDQAAAVGHCANGVDRGVNSLDQGAFGHCLWLVLRGDANGVAAGGGLFDSASGARKRREIFGANLRAVRAAAEQTVTQP